MAAQPVIPLMAAQCLSQRKCATWSAAQPAQDKLFCSFAAVTFSPLFGLVKIKALCVVKPFYYGSLADLA